MMQKFSSDNFQDKKQQPIKILKHCRICGDIAIHSYYGVIACSSCKVFFKRNAEPKQGVCKCKYGGHCEVDVHSRRNCSYCRLAKCFASGMQIELFRCPREKTNIRSQRKKFTTNNDQNTSTVLIRLNLPQQLLTLNLLQADHSTLTLDQWNLISNLSRCFDEYSGAYIGQCYMHHQNTLPLKLRFKSASLIQFFRISIDGIQLLYKNNKDFRSLPSNDRSTLLQSTIQYTGALATSFIYHQIGLSNYSAFYTALELTCHPSIASVTRCIQDRLDFDMITMKLFLAIICFSTTTYTFYSNTPSINLSNIGEVLRIQNTYIELTWKYLVYRYSFKQAVKCFSDLTRCLFLLHQTIVTAQDLEWVTETIDSLVEQTQKTLTFNN